jgi:hypothetical protein
VWGIVYLFSGYAKCLSIDKRTTPHFLYLIIPVEELGGKQISAYYV